MDISELNEKIKNESTFIDLLIGEISKVIVGQKEMIERFVITSYSIHYTKLYESAGSKSGVN